MSSMLPSIEPERSSTATRSNGTLHGGARGGDGGGSGGDGGSVMQRTPQSMQSRPSEQ